MYIRQAGPASYRHVLKEVRQKEIYKLIVDTNPKHIHHFFRAVSSISRDPFREIRPNYNFPFPRFVGYSIPLSIHPSFLYRLPRLVTVVAQRQPSLSGAKHVTASRRRRRPLSKGIADSNWKPTECVRMNEFLTSIRIKIIVVFTFVLTYPIKKLKQMLLCIFQILQLQMNDYRYHYMFTTFVSISECVN